MTTNAVMIDGTGKLWKNSFPFLISFNSEVIIASSPSGMQLVRAKQKNVRSPNRFAEQFP